MAYRDEVKEDNQNIRERYELAINRIACIEIEKGISVKEPYRDYFVKAAAFLLQIKEVFQLVETGQLKQLSLQALQKWNETLYQDLIEVKIDGAAPEDNFIGYQTSYANPSYANAKLGENYGGLLCFLYTELRALVPYAYEERLFDITIALELFIEIFNYFEQEDADTYTFVKSAIYYYISDYCDITLPKRIQEQLDPNLSFATEIIVESNLFELNYLYYYGEYIGENELKAAAFLQGLSQEQIDAMASTYTEGFRQGFLKNNMDLEKKSTVNIRYPLGLERIVRAAIKQFEAMGLKPIIYRAAVSSIHKRQHLKIGYCSTSVNKQFDYDHRFDDAFYLDKALSERKLVHVRLGYEACKELAAEYAGPAVIEFFGEQPFEPINKPEVKKHSKKQEKITVDYRRDTSLLINEYINSEEYSFTIISYPMPEIGEDFEQIFAETVKINTLDSKVYEKIQQKIIDVLDKGKAVHIVGKGNNKTDIKVMLSPLKNPKKETNFENCLADVNIPLGEVFTSPQLEGTNGILHVGEVYLNDLKYIDLELQFKDGKIEEYTCKNFSREEKYTLEEREKLNKNFIKENLMYQREFLPLGEFAIGTNTAAYAMGKRFGISHKLPILIAEKTGPHFAVGDTCYKMCEEVKVFNPDGKEVVAKDNTCSMLRKTDIEKAYFHCHTDITIPYDELGKIVVCCENGEEIEIIKDGRFVLEGTELLNQALEAECPKKRK